MKARFFLALAALLPGAVCSAQDYSQLKLDETHLLLNAYATPEELASPYVAATLQTLGELSADRRTLTLPAGTTVYIAPGVYWTDETYRQGFPFDDSGFVIAPPNVGLTLLGDNISFIGLSGDPEDVRIAGNRGEGGAKGQGAGGNSDVGQRAAEESRDEIGAMLKGTHVINGKTYTFDTLTGIMN